MAANTGLGQRRQSTMITKEFAVETVRRWWDRMGRRAYPQAKRLLITADGGGSNGKPLRCVRR